MQCTQCGKTFDDIEDRCDCEAPIIAGMTCDMAGAGGVD